MHPALLLEQLKQKAQQDPQCPAWVKHALETLYKEAYVQGYKDGQIDFSEEDDEAQEDRS